MCAITMFVLGYYGMGYPMSIHFQTQLTENLAHGGSPSTCLCHNASEEPICPSVGRRALGANDRVVMVPLVPRRRVKSSAATSDTKTSR